MARHPCAPCHSRLTGGIRRNLVRGAVNPSLPTARTHYTGPCDWRFPLRYIKHGDAENSEATDLMTESPEYNKGNERGRGESTESTGDKVSGMVSDANPGSIESWIDEARGCRLTNIAPWTHTPISHPVHGIKKPDAGARTYTAGGCRLLLPTLLPGLTCNMTIAVTVYKVNEKGTIEEDGCEE